MLRAFKLYPQIMFVPTYLLRIVKVLYQLKHIAKFVSLDHHPSIIIIFFAISFKVESPLCLGNSSAKNKNH